MKKRILTCMAALLPLALAAQVGDPRRDVSVGVNVGYSLSQVSFQPAIPQTLKGDMSYGLTVRYNCEKYFKSLCGLQIELNYANMGWEEKIETSSDTYRRDMHYIQLPMLARMGWGHERKGALGYAIAGPQLGFLLSENEVQGGEFSDETLMLRPAGVTAQYGKKAEHRLDYGLTAGFGLEINTPRAGHFLLDARYYLALGDVFKNSKKDDFGRSAFTGIYVKFAYLFDVLRTRR